MLTASDVGEAGDRDCVGNEGGDVCNGANNPAPTRNLDLLALLCNVLGLFANELSEFRLQLLVPPLPLPAPATLGTAGELSCNDTGNKLEGEFVFLLDVEVPLLIPLTLLLPLEGISPVAACNKGTLEVGDQLLRFEDCEDHEDMGRAAPGRGLGHTRELSQGVLAPDKREAERVVAGDDGTRPKLAES